MTDPPRIISSRKELLENYHELRAGDIICGKIPLKQGEEYLLLDLVSRDIRLIPSATAQMASRSKCYQAEILKPWMVPETTVIYDSGQLLELTNHLHGKNIGKIILKKDTKNAGIGVLLYNSIEDVYNQAAHNLLPYPFVIQPYLENCVDIRVIILGDYHEAYRRWTPHGFRNNLHCGGTAQPFNITTKIHTICNEVMARGRFPYAHLDLLQTEDNKIFFSEISLRGGIRGAQIASREYHQRVATLLQNALENYHKIGENQGHQ